MKHFKNLKEVEVDLDRVYTGRDVYLEDYIRSWVEEMERKYLVQLDIESTQPEVGKDLGIYLTGKILVYADDTDKIKRFVKDVLGKELDIEESESVKLGPKRWYKDKNLWDKERSKIKYVTDNEALHTWFEDKLVAYWNPQIEEGWIRDMIIEESKKEDR